jgi:hypothetical protein
MLKYCFVNYKGHNDIECDNLKHFKTASFNNLTSLYLGITLYD